MISVVIPMRNCEDTVGPLLEALLSGNYKNFEIIAVDDGSEDDTADVAAKYPVRVLTTGGRSGPAAARNLGARAAKGQILLFLDADTLPRPDLIEHVATRFDADPQLTAIVGYYDKIPLNRGFFPRYKALLVHHWFHNATVMESFETCCGAIRKCAFERAGGFDEAYTDADVEDYEFGHRVMEQGRIEVDHSMIVRHRFPSFRKNFGNYRRRSRLWMRLFLDRRRFESAATTGEESLSRIVAVLSAVLIAAGVEYTPMLYAGLAALALYLALIRNFLILLFHEEGLVFAIKGLAAHLANSFAVALGAGTSLAERLILRRGSHIDLF